MRTRIVRRELIKYKLREQDDLDYTLVTWTLVKGGIEPDELKVVVDASPPAKPSRGVVLSGRGPWWFYPCLTHRYHYTNWVAVYDPRREAAVVVYSHSAKRTVGELIAIVDYPE